MNQIGKPYNHAWLIAALALLLAGLAALFFSGTSMARLHAWLSAWRVDGKADFLTPQRYQRLVLGARAMGAALIVLSGLVWLLRRRVASLMGESAAGLAAIPTDLFQAVSGLQQRGETGHFILLAVVLLGFLEHWLTDHQGAWIGFAGLLGPAPLLLALGSNPYQRVWLFLCPVILGIAAVGLSWILQQFVQERHSKAAHGIAIMAITIGLDLYIAWSDGIRVSEEGATLRDAAAITQRITGQWRDGDALLTACPADEPLAFQFKRRGMPMALVFALLTGGLEKAGRIWVITKPPPGPLLENLLNSAGGQIKEFKQPELVEKYPQATLYLMVREKALTSAVR